MRQIDGSSLQCESVSSADALCTYLITRGAKNDKFTSPTPLLKNVLYLQTLSPAFRLLIYFLPVTVLSFALNVPKFMEITVAKSNDSYDFVSSEERTDPTYIFW